MDRPASPCPAAASGLSRLPGRPIPPPDRRLVASEALEQRVEVPLDHEQVAVDRAEEALLLRSIEERDKRPVVARWIEDADRLRVELELGPREHLGELLERAQPA